MLVFFLMLVEISSALSEEKKQLNGKYSPGARWGVNLKLI